MAQRVIQIAFRIVLVLLLASRFSAGTFGSDILFWDFENPTFSGDVSTFESRSADSISAFATQTGGGPSELFDRGDGYVHITRYFGTNVPYIEFTNEQPIELTGATFHHNHNHNRPATAPSYDVQLQLNSGNGFANVGSPIPISVATKRNTDVVDFGQINVPAGTHQLRWVPLNLGDGAIDTDSDYFMLNNLSIQGSVIGQGAVCTELWCQSENRWTGASDGKWGVGLNWAQNVIPSGVGVSAVFEEASLLGRSTINVNDSVTLGQLVFTPSVLTTIGGNGSLRFDAGQSDPQLRVAGRLSTLNLDVDTSWSGQLHVDVNEASLLNWTGPIATSTGEMVKQGTGTLQLRSGSPNWNGRLIIESGIVEAFDSQSLGRGGPNNGTQINHGAELRLNGDVSITQEPIRLNGGTLSGFRYFNPGPVVSSNVTLLADSQLRGGDAESFRSGIHINGVISGNFGIETSGSVTLYGTNTYTGDTVVSGGNLSGNNSNAFGAGDVVRVQEGGRVHLSSVDFSAKTFYLDNGGLEADRGEAGPIVLVGAGEIRSIHPIHGISGDGQLTTHGTILMETENSYTGPTVIRGVTRVRHPHALGAPTAGTSVAEHGELFIEVLIDEPLQLDGGSIVFHDDALAYDQAITSNGGRLRAAQGFDAPLILQAGSTVLGGVFEGAVTGTGELVLHNATIQSDLGHVGNTIITGSVELPGPNSYAGETIIDGASRTFVRIDHAEAFGVSNSPIPVTNATVDTSVSLGRQLRLDGAEIWLRDAATISTDNVIVEGPTTSVLHPNGGTFSGDVTVLGETVLRNGTFQSEISGPGDILIYHDGDVTRLQGNNTYTGTTRIYSNVEVSSTSALGDTSIGTIVSAGELDLQTTVSEPLSVSESGTIRVRESLPRLPAFAVERRRPETDARLILESPGSFGGRTIVAGGELQASADSEFEELVIRRDGGIRTSANAHVQVAHPIEIRSGDMTISGLLSAPSINKSSLGMAWVRDLTGYAGEIVVLEGTLALAEESTLHPDAIIRVEGPRSSLNVFSGTIVENDIFFGGEEGHEPTNLIVSNQETQLDGHVSIGAGGAHIAGDNRLALNGPVSGGPLVSSAWVVTVSHPDSSLTGELRIAGGNFGVIEHGRLGSPERIVIENGGTLILQNDANSADRIGDQTPIEMRGGVFEIGGANNESIPERVGTITVAEGRSRISTRSTAETSPLTMTSLIRTRGAVVNFVVENSQQVVIDQAPLLQNSMIGAWATAGESFATYDDGVRSLPATKTDINVAAADDILQLHSTTPMSRDTNVYAAIGGEAAEISLGGHRLTVESGGIMGRQRFLDGEITVGADANQELIIHQGQVDANIVDNALGSVDLLFVGDGSLGGNNSHTGTTTLLGAANSTAQVTLGPGAVPAGGDLVVDNVRLRFSGDSTDVQPFGHVTVKGESVARFGSSASINTAEIQSGHFEAPAPVELRKTTPGAADVHFHTGSASRIVIEEGTLCADVHVRQSPITVNGGWLEIMDNRNDAFTAPIELDGGMLRLRDASVSEPVRVTSSSVIEVVPDRPNARKYGLQGGMVGNAPLQIIGDSSALALARSSLQYHGDVDIEGVRVAAFPNSLGTGTVRIGPEGELELLSDSELATEDIELSHPVVIHGGSLIAQISDRPVQLSAHITVVDEATIGNANDFSRLHVTSPIELTDNSTLLFNGIGSISFDGGFLVGTSTSIDARTREIDDGDLGSLRIPGAIVANAENAQLDLVAVGVDFDGVFNIPAGQSLKVTSNGQPINLELNGEGAALAGAGTLENGVIIGQDGIVSPGASPGELTVKGLLQFDAGGTYEWEIANAGSNGVHDRIVASAGLSITANASQPFRIEVMGLTETGDLGTIDEFEANRSRTWQIVQTDSSAGDLIESIEIDTSQFVQSNATAHDSRWYVSERDGGVYLTYLVPSEIDEIRDAAERQTFVREMLRTWMGDSNFDGEFNASDLVAVFTTNEYEDLEAGNSTWQTGDWDGDGDFTSSDLVFAFMDAGYERGPRAATHAVPEPKSISLFWLALLLCFHFQRRRCER